MSKFPMTVQGARALEEEVKHLKGVLRPQISQAIAEARELGDLKENAEYHAAREQQGMVERVSATSRPSCPTLRSSMSPPSRTAAR